MRRSQSSIFLILTFLLGLVATASAQVRPVRPVTSTPRVGPTGNGGTHRPTRPTPPDGRPGRRRSRPQSTPTPAGGGAPGSFTPSGVGEASPRPVEGVGSPSPTGPVPGGSGGTTPTPVSTLPTPPGLAGFGIPRAADPSPAPLPKGGETGPLGDANSEDSWLNWWRLNEAWYLDLERRYLSRNRERELDADLFTPADTPVARPADATSEVLRSRVLPVLKRLTAHSHPGVRAEAVLALGKIGQRIDLPLITPLLSDKDKNVRKAAILALGLLKTPASRPFLSSILKSRRRQDAEIAYAAVALGLLGQRKAVPVLIQRLKQGRGVREVESSILYALGLLDTPRSRAFLEYYVLSPSRDDVLRSVGVQALALGGHPESIDVLLRVVDDPDVNIRRSAVIGLGRVRFVSPFAMDLEVAERELAEHFDGDGTERADLIAGDYLGRLRLKAEEDTLRLAALKEDVVARLVKDGLGDSDVMVRNFAALALGELGGTQARKALQHLLETTRLNSTRAFASLGLAVDGDKADRKVVFRRLAKGRIDPSTRAAMMLSLGLLGEGGVSDFAIRRLQNLGDTTSSRFAAVSLGLVGEKRALPFLRTGVTRSGRPELKRAFGLGLALLGDTEVVKSLGKLLNASKASETRIQTAAALSAINDISAMDVLLKAATSKKHKAKDIELAAFARAIGVIGERGWRPILSPVFRHLNYLTPVQALREIALL